MAGDRDLTVGGGALADEAHQAAGLETRSGVGGDLVVEDEDPAVGAGDLTV